MNIPNNFKLTFSKAQIDQQVVKLGKEISTWADQVWADSHTDILAISILRGGIFFFADLVREIKASIEIAAIKSSSYESSVNQVQKREIKINTLDLAFKGRRVLIIDDLCDSGRTLLNLKEHLLKEGALEVRSAVLIKRKVEKEIFNPDWIGFHYAGPEWFVGYGMEDCNRWMNLPDVYIISQIS